MKTCVAIPQKTTFFLNLFDPYLSRWDGSWTRQDLVWTDFPNLTHSRSNSVVIFSYSYMCSKVYLYFLGGNQISQHPYLLGHRNQFHPHYLKKNKTWSRPELGSINLLYFFLTLFNNVTFVYILVHWVEDIYYYLCKQMKRNILKYAHDVECHYLELTLSPFLWGDLYFL